MDHEDDEDRDAQELNAMMAQGRKRLGFCWGRHGNEFLLWKTRPRNERELVPRYHTRVVSCRACRVWHVPFVSRVRLLTLALPPMVAEAEAAAARGSRS